MWYKDPDLTLAQVLIDCGNVSMSLPILSFTFLNCVRRK